MANLLNLDAETGANAIGDDSSPLFTFEQTSSGEILKLQNAGGTGNALSVVSTPTTAVFVASANIGADIRSGATTAPALSLQHTTLNGPTIAPLKIVASTASGAFMHFVGAVISTASINLAANQTAGFVQVYIQGTGGNAIGYLPIFKGVA